MISVLQASAWYPPNHLGGTEVYLTGLVRELRAHGIHSRIIAPLAPGEPDRYQFDGATVRTYPVNTAPSRAELLGDRPHVGFERFRQLLTEERPEIFHQHSWTRGLGGAHLRAAREAGAKTVLTIHTPNNFCLRGTMMRFGREACDGRIDPPSCSSCWAQGRGAPLPATYLLGALPPVVSAAFERVTIGGRLVTALSARSIAERRRREFARMTSDSDRIVAVSGWLFETLVLNGVPADKLVLSRQGVDTLLAQQAAAAIAAPDYDRSPVGFRLLYLGRWHPVKGLQVLVRAVCAIPHEVPVTLTIHGVGESAQDQTYAAEIRRLAAGDSRIAIEPPVPRECLAQTLAQASALAIPSLWLETGPLVALEAKAAGLPVIGSRLGGIAELVREPEDGVLLPPGDIGAWTAAIVTIASNPARRPRPSGATAVRTMRQAADDMAALYTSLCPEAMQNP